MEAPTRGRTPPLRLTVGPVQKKQSTAFQAVEKSLQRNGFESQTKKCLPAPNQWQGGAVHHHAPKRMGVRNAAR